MRPFITFLLLFLFTGCGETRIDQKTEGERLMQVSREWARTISPDSLERIMSFWADSAIFLTDKAPPIYGKPAIRKMVAESLKMPGFKMSWEPVSATISESGDMGYLFEKSSMTMINAATGQPVTLFGQAVTIWRKDADGNWKNVVEVSLPDHTKDK